MLTDKEMLQATFNLIGSLARRITGERPIIRVMDKDGDIHHIYPDETQVTWIGDRMDQTLGAGAPHGSPSESDHTPGSRPDLPGATPLEPHRSADR